MFPDDRALAFSVLAEPGTGRFRLSPAYDLLCTRLVIPDDPLALPLGGRDRRLTRHGWLAFAAYAGLGRAAQRELQRLAARREPLTRVINASFLPREQKEAYVDLVAQRTEVLRARSAPDP